MSFPGQFSTMLSSKLWQSAIQEKFRKGVEQKTSSSARLFHPVALLLFAGRLTTHLTCTLLLCSRNAVQSDHVTVCHGMQVTHIHTKCIGKEKVLDCLCLLVALRIFQDEILFILCEKTFPIIFHFSWQHLLCELLLLFQNSHKHTHTHTSTHSLFVPQSRGQGKSFPPPISFFSNFVWAFPIFIAP